MGKIRRSSNGRTAVSEAAYLGSNPSLRILSKIKMIEIEKRAFLNKPEYERLKYYFDKHGEFIKMFKRFTFLQINRSDFVPDVSAKTDIRIRIDDGKKAKLTVKSGNWHNNEPRQEFEIHFDPKEVKDAVGMIHTLGNNYFIVVYFERCVYKYENYEITLDKYYFNDNYVLEIEAKSPDNQIEVAKEEAKILDLMKQLKIKPPTETEIVEFISKLNFIKECQVDFTKITIDEWYEKWKEFIYCRI